MAASVVRERLVTVAAMAALLAAAILPGALATADPANAALVPDPAAEVNPFIGTADDGNDFPGADTPFGMLQWSPDTVSRPDGGGYAYGDSAITGFSLTHLGGPGCRAAGDIPVLPVTGAAALAAAAPTATDSFSHAGEAASAGYYRVALGNGVTTQLTATTRTGLADFSFPARAQAGLILRLAGSQRQVLATSFTVVSHTEIQGSATSGNFCGAGNKYTIHFDMQFSRPFTGVTSYGRVGGGPATVALSFGTGAGRLLAKAGISYVSVANARLNLAAEDRGWSFTATRDRASAAWNALLGRVRIGGGSAAEQAVFYTALYHSLLYPSVFSDDNRQYLGVDGRVHTVDPGHAAFYTNFSGWDIYRAQAQLEALVDPDAASDAAQSMLDDYAQGGTLPKWMQNNVETYFMVGDPADPVLADYYAFGARHFDAGTALADMIAEATTPGPDRPGLSDLEQLGFVPVGGDYGCCNYYEPVSTTLEYDTDDFAISALAGALGQRAAQAKFLRPGPGLAQRAQPGQPPGPAPRRGRKLGARLRAAQHVRVRRGRLAGLHRHGAVQPGRPDPGQGRPGGHGGLPEHRAGQPHRRGRRRLARQRAQPRAALGVRLHRPARADRGHGAPGRGRAVDRHPGR